MGLHEAKSTSAARSPSSCMSALSDESLPLIHKARRQPLLDALRVYGGARPGHADRVTHPPSCWEAAVALRSQHLFMLLAFPFQVRQREVPSHLGLVLQGRIEVVSFRFALGRRARHLGRPRFMSGINGSLVNLARPWLRSSLGPRHSVCLALRSVQVWARA